MPIKFGTDGWRAVISDEFTFANVRLVAQAVADHAVEEADSPSVVVGFDTRFLSDRYAIEVARVLAANGVIVHLTKADAPTPAVSHAVKDLGADWGIMITASHNPPRYNGIKLKAAYGGSASPAQCAHIEEHLEALQREERSPSAMDYETALAQNLIRRFDPVRGYWAHVRTLVDVEAIRNSGLRVVVEPMYGAGRGYVRDLLAGTNCRVKEIHGELNPGFGGLHPEPIGRHLGDLIGLMKEEQWDVGLATDGDADRIGAVAASGRFVDPHCIFALTLRYLVEQRDWRGAVVKTVSTTQMVNRLAERYGLPLYETPVGFNHICDLMLSTDVLMGGEESGGISIKGHVPEGDGLLMGLLLLEMMAAYGQSLETILNGLMDDIGHFHYSRRDLRVSPFSKGELVTRLMAQVPKTIGGLAVTQVNDSDGVKYVLADDSWLLIRPSGTEPVLRVYAESTSQQGVERLLDFGQSVADSL